MRAQYSDRVRFGPSIVTLSLIVIFHHLKKHPARNRGDSARDFAFEREDIFHRTLVSFDPGMVAVAKVDQLKGNTHLVLALRTFILEQVLHAKIATNCVKTALLTRHVRTRALRVDYFKTGQARQIACNLILHSYREIGVLAIPAVILKRQNHDRPLHRRRSLRAFLTKLRCNRGDD